ncbi:MAG TPA: RdgB/HAM1 family non-canonical purine NTP pyrophosphatase [Bdellovibrionota bacterium]|jgi:XTP/dITP diphosphohydrolase|nr:RdgB/HAM1 family non-canonical purine NTP pyrophosphatase [Bdellovibrionota bacterium]
MQIFIATGNPGKLKELRESLAEFYPGKFSDVQGRAARDAEETSETFEGNAKIKSHALVKELIAEGHSDFYVLADDSGLVVDELGGAPGVHSARYAGDHVEPAQHMQKLLAALKAIPVASRESNARYVCALSMIRVLDGRLDREVSSTGTCEGSISFESAGSSGFGYDPIFWVPHRGCTMAELRGEEKNEISHRHDAFRLLKKL